MYVWMYGCMDVWMYGCMDVWLGYVMLCFVLLCYVMLCYIMSCMYVCPSFRHMVFQNSPQLSMYKGQSCLQ